jgi:hypothetical protein
VAFARRATIAARQNAARPFARPFEIEFSPHAVALTERFATGFATESDQPAAKLLKKKRKIGGERETSTSNPTMLICWTFIAYVNFGTTTSYQQSALLPDLPVRRLRSLKSA